MMFRYFIELAYKGTNYAGFQVQRNANTIQGEVEKAMKVYWRKEISLTGSSRTDAGVHAQQNYFQMDIDVDMPIAVCEKAVYHLNAILPNDISIKKISKVANNHHCRFDAESRSYIYSIYQFKNPFLNETGFYYPYLLDVEKLQEAADTLKSYNDFESFAKKHNQAYTNICTLFESEWILNEHSVLHYHVRGNRFLRGMVRALVGTMLPVGRGQYSLDTFQKIIEGKDPSKANFATPAHGLCLKQVRFPASIIG